MQRVPVTAARAGRQSVSAVELKMPPPTLSETARLKGLGLSVEVTTKWHGDS
jgi:hypothetical protein